MEFTHLEFNHFLLLSFVGLLSGFLNVVAGGGSTLTLPVLIFMGMPAPLANGTNRVGIFIQTLAATASFRKYADFSLKESFLLGLLTLPGAIIGTIYATHIDTKTFEKILGIVMLGIIVTLLIPRKKVLYTAEHIRKFPKLLYPVMILAGFYGGFIQVGIGFILMAIFQNILHLSLLRVNIHKTFVVFLYMVPSLAIFIYTYNVNWSAGIVLAVSSAIGAWVSAKMSVRKGDSFIRFFLIVAIAISAAKLIGIY